MTYEAWASIAMFTPSRRRADADGRPTCRRHRGRRADANLAKCPLRG